MKVLVTGADGLLGGHLVRKLLARDLSVRVFIQPGSASPSLAGLTLDRVEGDLIEDDGRLEEALPGCRYVFHCAAITDFWADPDLVWKVNLEGTRRMLDACLKADVERLVFVGSASSFQFGSLENPGDESAPYPRAYRGVPYMESKHKATELVREYTRDRGLDAVIVSPTFLMGGYDSRPSSGELIRQFLQRGLRVASPGGRNFACARDVAAAMTEALDKGRTGERYILGGQNLSYLDFFTRVARIAGVEPPRRVLPRAVVLAAGAAGSLSEKLTGRRAFLNLPMARMSCLSTFYSPAKAVAELGMPQTSIDAAIEESYKSLKEYGHIK